MTMVTWWQASSSSRTMLPQACRASEPCGRGGDVATTPARTRRMSAPSRVAGLREGRQLPGVVAADQDDDHAGHDRVPARDTSHVQDERRADRPEAEDRREPPEHAHRPHGYVPDAKGIKRTADRDQQADDDRVEA